MEKLQKNAAKGQSLTKLEDRTALKIQQITALTPNQSNISKLGQKQVLLNAVKVLQGRFLFTTNFGDCTPTEFCGLAADHQGKNSGREKASVVQLHDHYDHCCDSSGNL